MLDLHRHLPMELVVGTRIAIDAWTGSDGVRMINNLRFSEMRRITSCGNDNARIALWCEIENALIQKMMQHNCKIMEHSKLRKIVSFCIRSIGLQIIEFKDMCETELCEESIFWKYLHKLCWMPWGEINYVQLAKMMVRDETVDIVFRYKIACMNCFKRDIELLYFQLSDECKRRSEISDPYFHMWGLEIEGNSDALDDLLDRCERGLSFKQYGLLYAAEQGYMGAALYFLQEISEDEKSECIIDACKRAALGVWSHLQMYKQDVCIVLWSHLFEYQWYEVLRDRDVVPGLLFSLLKFYNRHLFIKNAKVLKHFLTPSKYSTILHYITNLCAHGFEYQELWRQFWQLGLSVHRQQVIDDYISETWHSLNLLFNANSFEIIKLFFEEATLAQKKKLIFSSGWRRAAEELYDKNEKDLAVNVLFRCLDSQDELIQFWKNIMDERPKEHHYLELLQKMNPRDPR